MLCGGLGAGGNTHTTVSLADPLCLAHMTRWRAERNLVEGHSVAVKGNSVFLGNNPYRLFEAQFHTGLETMVYHHKDGRFADKLNYGNPKGILAPVARLAVIHGGGGMKSQGGSWLNFMNLIMTTKSKIGSTAELLRRRESWQPLIAESIDLPGYAYGTQMEEYLNVEAKMNYLIRWFEDIKASSPLPLIIAARSASTGFLPAIAHARPDLIDGIILISPMHPIDGLEENRELGFAHARETGEFLIGSAEERQAWISEKLAQGLLLPQTTQGDSAYQGQALAEFIEVNGGFPANGSSERLRWVERMQEAGILRGDIAPLELVDRLGAMPGGTPEQRQQWIERKLKADEFIPNMRGLKVLFDWYDQMAARSTGPLAWYRQNDPFNGIPTMVMVGGQDWQVPESVQRAYQRHVTQAQRNQPLTRYRFFPKLGHDVVAVQHHRLPDEGLSEVLDVYGHLFDFVSEVLARRNVIDDLDDQASRNTASVGP